MGQANVSRVGSGTEYFNHDWSRKFGVHAFRPLI